MQVFEKAEKSFQNIGFGRESLAPFASLADESRGRLLNENESRTRTAFQRDRDRIIHSTAFRRLKHKTQVFIFHEGDHFRTRLTHTIEVAQMARSIARALRLDEDLAEALALAHDLGHTPFGHAGEDALSDVMKNHGGFEHNGQTLRIVTALERRYAAFDGLNLTFETLEGIAKHNGPLEDEAGNPIGKYKFSMVPGGIKEYSNKHDLILHSHASLEAQAAAIADDIAYNAHDIDDGLREGIFQLDDLIEVPMVGDLLKQVRRIYPNLDVSRTTHELVRCVITVFIEDVISTTKTILEKKSFKSVDDVRYAGQTLINFSSEYQMADQGIKAFLFEHMYRSDEMMAKRQAAQEIVTDLFGFYLANPGEMSHEVNGLEGEAPLTRRVSDYVAGMTDRFAVQEHRRLFDVTPKLR